jgi:hypothetical protein
MEFLARISQEAKVILSAGSLSTVCGTMYGWRLGGQEAQELFLRCMINKWLGHGILSIKSGRINCLHYGCEPHASVACSQGYASVGLD